MDGEEPDLRGVGVSGHGEMMRPFPADPPSLL